MKFGDTEYTNKDIKYLSCVQEGLIKEKVMQRKVDTERELKEKLIPGAKFNKLTYVESTGERNNLNVMLHRFLCDCGKYTIRPASRVVGGFLKSCGCLIYTSRKGNESNGWEGCGEVPRRYFSNTQKHAKVRNVQFTLTIEYIWQLFLKQDRKCALSGTDLSLWTYKSVKNNISVRPTASLDRIDSSIGYIKGNVQWVHKDINRMKSDFPQEYFLNWCKLVAEANKIEVSV